MWINLSPFLFLFSFFSSFQSSSSEILVLRYFTINDSDLFLLKSCNFKGFFPTLSVASKWALFNWVSNTKSKIITMVYRIKGNTTRSQKELKTKKYHEHGARENTSDKVVIGFSFDSDSLTNWLKFFRPITERIKVNLIQSWIRLSRLNWKLLQLLSIIHIT